MYYRRDVNEFQKNIIIHDGKYISMNHIFPKFWGLFSQLGSYNLLQIIIHFYIYRQVLFRYNSSSTVQIKKMSSLTVNSFVLFAMNQ